MKYLKAALIVMLVAVYLATGWAVGLLLIAVALLVFLRDLVRARRALRTTIQCPWCNESVEQYGAFTCASCRARTLGWAWQCNACRAEHGHISCPSCELSIPNPLLPPP
ncbi:MAG: hypothetical protein U0414_31965 [Polyangiaceae bacterium]